jgi:hypothetical protein
MATPKTVQLCLVMDCTASMDEWIQAAKTRLISSLQTIKQSFPTHVISVAFVGYRDARDDERFIVHEFTTNHDAVLTTIRSANAIGGDDIAEDVSGAYHKVVSFDWTADVRVLFHVCDAPDHGREYHSPYVDDSYPDGLGGPSLKELVKIIAEKQVDVNFLRISAITDVMTTIMQEEYKTVRASGFLVMNIPVQSYPSLFGGEGLGRHSSSEVFETMLVRTMSSSIESNPGQP